MKPPQSEPALDHPGPPPQVSGYLIATVCMFVGLVILALPITIIGANFDELYREMRKKEHLRKQV
jgi:hypothetical protein